MPLALPSLIKIKEAISSFKITGFFFFQIEVTLHEDTFATEFCQPSREIIFLNQHCFPPGLNLLWRQTNNNHPNRLSPLSTPSDSEYGHTQRTQLENYWLLLQKTPQNRVSKSTLNQPLFPFAAGNLWEELKDDSLAVDPLVLISASPTSSPCFPPHCQLETGANGGVQSGAPHGALPDLQLTTLYSAFMELDTVSPAYLSNPGSKPIALMWTTHQPSCYYYYYIIILSKYSPNHHTHLPIWFMSAETVSVGIRIIFFQNSPAGYVALLWWFSTERY